MVINSVSAPVVYMVTMRITIVLNVGMWSLV